MRVHVTVFWHDDACLTHTCSVTGPVIVGDTPDAHVALPCARRLLSPGEHTVGDFLVCIREVLASDAVVAPRVVRPQARWLMVSAALHAAVLVLAFFFALRSDPRQVEAARIDQLRGYLSRLAEQPRDEAGQVESIQPREEARDDRAGESGDGANHALLKDATPAKSAPLKAAPSAKVHRASRRGGGSGDSEGASSCAAFAHSDHDPSAHWIEFTLTDEAKRPVRGEPYRVTLPDGTVHEGKTDERGLVCFTNIKPGNARIEWPRLGNAARYVGPDKDPI